MKLESQVVSLELAKRMAELGFTKESLFVWWEDDDGKWAVEFRESMPGIFEEVAPDAMITAYTVAELGEITPIGIADKRLLTLRGENHWNVGYDDGGRTFVAPTEADARAKMLIHLAEQKLIDPNPPTP